MVDEGHIAGIGTHSELLKNCEVYQQIAASQLSEAELAGGSAENGIGAGVDRCGDSAPGAASAGKEVPVNG